MIVNKKSNQDNYYPWFDLLRIILACTVMFSHSGLLSSWEQAGNFSVQIFFALSGWLIGGILLKLKASDLPRFYFNRATRIWIPYFIALILLVTASIAHHDLTNSKWFEFVFYKISFVYNIFGPPQLALHRYEMPLAGTGNHFWSINAEEQFYLLAPLFLVSMAWIGGRKSITWIVIAVLALISHTYASIVFGVLAAVAVNNHGDFHTKLSARIAIFTVLAASIFGIITGLDYWLMAPIAAIAIVLLLALKGKPHPWGVFVGGMSYSLYLNHWVGFCVITYLFKFLKFNNSGLWYSFSVLLNFLISASLYYWIDLKILAKRGQMYSLLRGRLAMIVSYAMIVVGIFVGISLNF